MPSQILHTLFGEDVAREVCRRLPSRFSAEADAVSREILDAHRKAFALGCQGPDIFYHSQRTLPVGLEYGTLLHRRGIGGFTEEMLSAVLAREAPGGGERRCGKRMRGGREYREKKAGAPLAYVLGFMTHAILDRAAHPYIVYKSGWLSPHNPESFRYDRSHAFFERIIDTLMLKLLRGEIAARWDQEGLLAETCENPPEGLKELIARSLAAAFPERAGKDGKLEIRVENAFSDAAFFYRLTSPAKKPAKTLVTSSGQFPLQKRHLVYLFPETVSDTIDFLNLGHRRWYYPAGDEKEDTRSFPEIYAEAVTRAAGAFAGILSRCPGEGTFSCGEIAAGEIARAVGNGGLSIVDENGKPCAPTRADPLPLDEELNRQAVLRGIREDD